MGKRLCVCVGGWVYSGEARVKEVGPVSVQLLDNHELLVEVLIGLFPFAVFSFGLCKREKERKEGRKQ